MALTAKNIKPYTGVEHEKKITFPNGRTFHVFTYQAYDAMGLIGSECNGVAICDVDNRNVVCDEIAKEGTGYFGVSPKQVEIFEGICQMNWETFRAFVNQQRRVRCQI